MHAGVDISTACPFCQRTRVRRGQVRPVGQSVLDCIDDLVLSPRQKGAPGGADCTAAGRQQGGRALCARGCGWRRSWRTTLLDVGEATQGGLRMPACCAWGHARELGSAGGGELSSQEWRTWCQRAAATPQAVPELARWLAGREAYKEGPMAGPAQPPSWPSLTVIFRDGAVHVDHARPLDVRHRNLRWRGGRGGRGGTAPLSCPLAQYNAWLASSALVCGRLNHRCLRCRTQPPCPSDDSRPESLALMMWSHSC